MFNHCNTIAASGQAGRIRLGAKQGREPRVNLVDFARAFSVPADIANLAEIARASGCLDETIPATLALNILVEADRLSLSDGAAERFSEALKAASGPSDERSNELFQSLLATIKLATRP